MLFFLWGMCSVNNGMYVEVINLLNSLWKLVFFSLLRCNYNKLPTYTECKKTVLFPPHLNLFWCIEKNKGSLLHSRGNFCRMPWYIFYTNTHIENTRTPRLTKTCKRMQFLSGQEVCEALADDSFVQAHTFQVPQLKFALVLICLTFQSKQNEVLKKIMDCSLCRLVWILKIMILFVNSTRYWQGLMPIWNKEVPIVLNIKSEVEDMALR